MKSKRQFIISGQHRRLQRLWQFFFTGWGLIFVVTLVAGGILNNNILWTPISAVNMTDITKNQFKMENPAFSGMDKDGNPFSIRAAAARQEYDDEDKIFLNKIVARIVHIDRGAKITDNITADNGVFDRVKNTVTLTGNVRVDSSNGDKVRTKEMVIRL
ncbi:MAG: LPS export ABC transporter periplasmic protein LptC [Alphaproteobacteria bacterium]|nr:LPS export ABC transporter periplasmic protein LptC [Alphaproteobacteria bacterium]